MPSGRRISLPVLPGQKAAQTPPEFAAGSLVYLRSLTCGAPGTVAGMKRGRVLVRWPAPLSFTGRHSPRALILAAAADTVAGVDEDHKTNEATNEAT